MASSSLREYRNLFAKAENFLPQADASTHPPLHRESVLRCWPQAASLETDSLRVPLVSRSRNRGLHSFPIQAIYWRCSKASLQLDHAEHHVLAPQHLDRRDVRAIHRLSVEVPIANAQVSAQAWFSPSMEDQPSNAESPHLPPTVGRATIVAVNLNRISKSAILQFMRTTTCLSLPK